MLKIKDDVDLKELEKFGFKIKYDVDTGEPCELIKEKYNWYGGVVATMSFKFTKDEIWSMSFEAKDNEHCLICWADVIYDLIQAGLIEKGGR